jgi:DNA polymerase III alpha subunit
MKTNHLHQTIIDESDIMEAIYRSNDPVDLPVKRVIVEDDAWIKRFKKSCQEYGLPFDIEWTEPDDVDLDTFIRENLADWRLPAEYLEIDLENYLLSKCNNDVQRRRVQLELEEFEQRDMLIVLKWLKYFVDTMRENNLIWGVGRGSSCASYCLFLIGIHKIDSIKYELDIKEFLK